MTVSERTVTRWPRPRLVWDQRVSVEPLLVIAACLVPLAGFTLAWGVSWLLDFGSADNWSYVKYFTDWTSSDPVLRFSMGTDYKGSRVAWIVFGWLAYHAFGPLAGSLVLNLTFAVLTVLVTLLVTSRLFGLAAGGLATIIASAYAGFYATGVAGFWSYHGVICAIFYMLFLFALAELAWRPDRRRWAVLAGLTVTLAVITTTNYVMALPSALVFWLLLRGRPSLREVAVLAAVGSGGAILGIALLAAANVLAGGEPLFMLPLLRVTLRSAGVDPGRPLLAAWLPRAAWLVFPFLVTVAGVLTVILRIPRRLLLREEYRPFSAAFFSFLVLWGTHFVLQATMGIFVEAPHYNFVVFGPATLALAGVMRHLPRPVAGGWRLPGYAYLLLALLLTLPQLALSPTVLPVAASSVDSLVAPWHLSAMLIESTLAGIVALVLIARGLTWTTIGLAGLCLGIAWNLINPYRDIVAGTPPACRLQRDNFLLVTDVAGWLGSRGWHADPRTWFSRQDVVHRPDGCGDVNLYLTYLAIEQADMVFQVTSPLPLPEHISDLDPNSLRSQVEANRRAFFIILSQPAAAPDLDRELFEWSTQHQVYIRPRPVRRETFSRGALSITVQVYGTGRRARRTTTELTGPDSSDEDQP